jgi:CRP-like cAMP-binding protein
MSRTPITTDDLAALLSEGSERTAAAGEVLVREGAEAGSLFLIRSGTVVVSRGAKRLDSLGAGDVLGELALIRDGHRSASAIVEEEAELVVVPASAVRRLMDERPSLAAALGRDTD